MKKLLLIYLIIINSICFISISNDKRIADAKYKTTADKNNRIAEVSIITLSSFGGALGTYIGFHFNDHKTSIKKAYLRNNIKILIIQNILIVLIIINNINLRKEKNGKRKQFIKIRSKQ